MKPIQFISKMMWPDAGQGLILREHGYKKKLQ